jgi:CheY-like chemotaxis protein
MQRSTVLRSLHCSASWATGRPPSLPPSLPRFLRFAERDNPVMVLLLTAADSPGDRVSGLGLGADDYLAKPFHFPNSSCASAPWPAGSPRPGPAS